MAEKGGKFKSYIFPLILIWMVSGGIIGIISVFLINFTNINLQILTHLFIILTGTFIIFCGIFTIMIDGDKNKFNAGIEFVSGLITFIGSIFITIYFFSSMFSLLILYLIGLYSLGIGFTILGFKGLKIKTD